MSLESLQNSNYQELMKEHILSIVEYMFESDQEFGIACETSKVSFEPNLPEQLQSSLPEVTLFMLVNYSFETARIDAHYISFEAGFEPDNFAAVVHIPLLAVKQLFVDEYPIFINVVSSDEVEEEKEVVDSMTALLNNPENAKLLKRK
ncbi:MAG TPA: hypothetical protein ENK82_08165 [Campylobacterales bacterium]|nr:hypothetical protein [Campylobacterales bacterium]HHS93308.1 hypothetical protein [Campylobacterales bacterium]